MLHVFTCRILGERFAMHFLFLLSFFSIYFRVVTWWRWEMAKPTPFTPVVPSGVHSATSRRNVLARAIITGKAVCSQLACLPILCLEPLACYGLLSDLSRVVPSAGVAVVLVVSCIMVTTTGRGGSTSAAADGDFVGELTHDDSRAA